MERTWIRLAVVLLVGVMGLGQAAASESKGVRGMIQLKPAFGLATGDDMVTGYVPADVSVTGIPLIGTVSTSLPMTAEIEFENPVGILFGGEVVFRRIGIEINGIYLHEAATARGGLRLRGGLLREEECDLLEAFGIPVPDVMLAEEAVKNLAVTLGLNYHFVDDERWGLWAGPMVVWTAWGQ